MDMIVFPYIVHLQRTPRFFLIQLHPVTFLVTYPKCYLHGELIANLFCIKKDLIRHDLFRVKREPPNNYEIFDRNRI